MHKEEYYIMFLNLSIVGNNSTKTLSVTFMVVICTAITIGVTPKPYFTNNVFNSGNISSNVNYPSEGTKNHTDIITPITVITNKPTI